MTTQRSLGVELSLVISPSKHSNLFNHLHPAPGAGLELRVALKDTCKAVWNGTNDLGTGTHQRPSQAIVNTTTGY